MVTGDDENFFFLLLTNDDHNDDVLIEIVDKIYKLIALGRAHSLK
jgi:hypothetical protein